MEFVMDQGGAVEASNLLKHFRDENSTSCPLKLARTDPFWHHHQPSELKISSYGSTLASLLHNNACLSDHGALVDSTTDHQTSSCSSFYGGISNARAMSFLQHAGSYKLPPASALPSFSYENSNDRSGLPSPFTFSQFRELQHQALIFKYMTSGVNVPIDLILPIRHSLLRQAASMAGNVGWSNYHLSYAANNDPEPGRCRRTDGKKWRCAREVVPDQKYCERHMHRGKNRAKKIAEAQAKPSNSCQSSSTLTSLSSSASPTTASVSLGINTTSSSSTDFKSFKPALNSTNFPSFQSPSYAKAYGSFNGAAKSDMDLRSQMFLSRGFAQQSPSTSSLSILSSVKNAWPTKQQSPFMLGSSYGGREAVAVGGHEPEGQPLRHFFDDWPRRRDTPTMSWSDMEEGRNKTSTTQLSISLPMASSDFNTTPAESSPRGKLSFSSLKLSMSMSGEDDSLALGVGNNMGFGTNEEKHGRTNWIPIVWETSPLAEMLQSTSSTPRGSSKNSDLNLMTEGWENSPRDSPSGVLHNTAFGSFSDSGSGSSTPAPTIKAEAGFHCGNNIQSSDSFSGTNLDT